MILDECWSFFTIHLFANMSRFGDMHKTEKRVGIRIDSDTVILCMELKIGVYTP